MGSKMKIVTTVEPKDNTIEFIFLGFLTSIKIFSKVQQIGQTIANKTQGSIDLSVKLFGGPTKNKIATKPRKTPIILKEEKTSIFKQREKTYVSIGTKETDNDKIPAGTLLAAMKKSVPGITTPEIEIKKQNLIASKFSLKFSNLKK